MGLRIQRFFKNEPQKILNGGKKFYIHPIFSNYAASKDGEILNVTTGRIFKKNLNNNGYYHFRISDKNLSKPKNYYIHRFEWECLKGVIPEGFVIDHCDSVKTNNKIENLQLLTVSENVRKGNSKPILSFNIKNNKQKKYESITSASLELDISFSIISNICRKVNYYKTVISKKDGDRYTFEFLEKNI